MKIVAPTLCLLALVWSAGCSSTREVSPTEYLQERIVYLDPDLEDAIDATALQQTEADGTRTVQLNLSSERRQAVEITYRLQWFDDSGFLLKQTDEVKLLVRPGDTEFLKSSIEDPRATNFRFVLDRYESAHRPF